MANIPKKENPHQASIDTLVKRVLPRVRAMPFAKNQKEPWLGNAAVDKAVIATIEQCFAISDEDQIAAQQHIEAQGELDGTTEIVEPEVLPAETSLEQDQS